MSSLDRPLRGQVLRFRLEEQMPSTEDRMQARGGRTSRTLIKHDTLRVVLIALAAGAEIAEHQAEGPITVQVLRGGITFRVADGTHDLRQGDLLTLEAGVRHSVRSAAGGAFLLTIGGTVDAAP